MSKDSENVQIICPHSGDGLRTQYHIISPVDGRRLASFVDQIDEGPHPGDVARILEELGYSVSFDSKSKPWDWPDT